MLSPKVTFVVCFIHLVYSHNILRLADRREAKFILRYDGKVPVTEHFSQFNVSTTEVCMDQCVATPPCKSVNHNEDLGLCQLVNYDITDGKDYTPREGGWVNYDTGRSRLTRLFSSDGSYCLLPQNTNPCGISQSSGVHLVYRLATNPHCQSIEAYYEFDRDSSLIIHYCSSLMLISYSSTDVTLQQITNFRYYTHASDRNRFWRIDENSFLNYAGRLAYANGDALSDNNMLKLAGTGVYPINDVSQIIHPDIETPPVLYYAFDFWTNPNSFDDFENNVRAYMVTRGVDVVKHLSEFTINPGLGFDTYAAQMQAIFSPDTTGEFEFWVIGGDYAMLFIGDDEQSTSRQLVAQLNGYTLSRSTANRGTKYLEEDKMYYMEVLFGRGAQRIFYLYYKRPQDYEPRMISHDSLYKFSE